MVTITGRVRQAIFDVPVPYAALLFEGPQTRTTITTVLGTYTLRELPPGIYSVTATKVGRKPKSVEMDVPDTPLYDAPDIFLEYQDIPEINHGIIGGIVMDKRTGIPLGAATITADGKEYVTTPNGYYFFVLPYGSYTVQVSRAGYKDQSQSATISTDKMVADVDFLLSKTMRGSTTLVGAVVFSAVGFLLGGGSGALLGAGLGAALGALAES